MDLSGEYISISNEMRKGFEIALKEKYNVPFELIYETDQGFSSSGAVKAFHRLLQKKVDVVLNWAYSTLPAIAPIANKAKIPVLAFWDSNKGILKLGEYIFASGVSAEKTAEYGAEFLVTENNFTKLSIYSIEDVYAELVTSRFVEKAKSLGANIVSKEVSSFDATDVKGIALRISNANPQAIYGCSMGSNLVSFIKEMRLLKYEGKFLFCEGLIDQDLRVLGNADSEGLLAMQPLATDLDFVKTIQSDQKDKTLTQIGYAGLAYDGLKIISNILDSINSKGEKITSESIKNSMKRYVHDGVTGRAVLGGESEKVEKIVVVKDGRFEVVE